MSLFTNREALPSLPPVYVEDHINIKCEYPTAVSVQLPPRTGDLDMICFLRQIQGR